VRTVFLGFSAWINGKGTRHGRHLLDAAMNDNGIQGLAAADQSRADTLKKWLVRELAQTVDISPEAIALDEPFSHFGLDSAKAVGLLSRLNEFLGRKIPVTLVWRYPTIDALANYLCGKAPPSSKERASSWLPVTSWNQPIAIIGIGCRFPGADDPEAFWESLRSGRSSFREISEDRWKIDEWYDPDLSRAGKMNARMAGLLERIDQFDPGFFAISPREATQIDPQQRLALELTWEALEDAGVNPDTLRGSRTGLFVGVVWHDYETFARKAGVEITAHSGTGQAFSIVANRISYALGLQGPSIALDTACSSSLVGVHLACRSLQAGDATLAIAGGVNMIIDPDTMVTLSKFGGLSPTSQLCAFDARANGFVRGEGGGFVVLKPLNRAFADGDHVYAVIRGTAVNNDGASNGLTAPNPQAQEAVLEEAYARAGIEAADVQYVEAHGTGTTLGDPIEAQALGNVLGHKRAADRPLLIGSVKTNIGHLEGAAGIAGLIKLVLSIHQRQIPPSLNFEIPNPHIDFAAANLRVVTALEPWPESNKPAVGGVSAFGWGGTNCHVVIEEATRSSAQLLPLSASDPETLKALAKQVGAQLHPNSLSFTLEDLCASAATRYSAGPERVALTARSLNELSAQLEGFLLGQKRPGITIGRAAASRPKLAFVFSPQGSQWLGMGRSLMAVEPVFRAKLVECEHALTKLAGWSLFNELLAAPADSRLNRVEFVQPTLFAMQVALAALWESWGVRPDFVAAHSLGEWAAACVAGALSVEDAMRVVVESSRAQAQASSVGGMAVVELPEPEVRERIRKRPGEVFVAGNNSPTSTIISGDAARVKSLVALWKEEGLLCSLIDVDVAAHCPAMDSALEKLRGSLTGLRPTRAAVPFVSSVSGYYLHGTAMGPEHWAHHLRQPVLFTQVIERLARDGCTLFLEISPHPLLVDGIQQTLAISGVTGVALSSCRRGDERESLLNSLGTLYTLGWQIDWPAVTGGGNDNLSLRVLAAPHQATAPITPAGERNLLLPLSGRTAEALKERARSVALHIRTKHPVAIRDIAYTAAARREHLEHRLAVVGVRCEELASALQAFSEGQNPVNVVTGRLRSTAAPKVAFVCSGQGPQWWGMGRELLRSLPIFRQEIARCADQMKQYTTWDLVDELTRDEASSLLAETEIAQPALFALQVALAAVWRSWGIEPVALIGHSVGEVAAAHLGGALSFDDAVKVICHRGRLMQRATGSGKMAAIELPEADVENLLKPYLHRACAAAINSPTSTVISGEAAAIDEIIAAAQSRGVRCKTLPVNYAFHSPQMDPFGTEMVEAVSGLTVQGASVPVYSTVTGAQATEEDFDAVYWGRNIRQTVRFAAAVQAMLQAGVNIFVELSPHPVLSSMVLQCAATFPQSVQILPSLRQGRPEQFEMLKSLSTLFAAGAKIDWDGVYPESGQVVPLPLYPWQRKRFWLDQGASLEPNAQYVQAEVPAHWFYEVGWEKKPRTDNASVRAVTRCLLSPKALEVDVGSRLALVESETRFVHSAAARNDIENLAVNFATASLMRLGLQFSPFRRFTSASLRKQLGVQTRHTRLFTRMLEMLVDRGLLEQSGPQFETTPLFQTASPSLALLADQATSFCRKHTDFTAEFELLARCGGELSGVLRGEVDPLQLLFPADGSVNAERLYRDSPSARFYNRLVGELVGNAVRDVSLGDTVRLLELGAGTGSTTACVLERLSGVRTKYFFTDISRMLLKEARAKFDRFPTVGYAILNIEKPLNGQAFDKSAYDIVLAANVLHATVDLRNTLKHVRHLLAPGGLLVLLETTGPRYWLDLIFGLTEGWWRFGDTALRPKNALIGTDDWLALLKDSGFRATAAVGAEFSAGDLHEQSVLLAKADDSSPHATVPDAKNSSLSAAGRWLIFSDNGGLAQQVARRLEQGGGECVLVQAGDCFDASNPRWVTINLDKPEDYRRIFKDGRLWRGVLHAWTLDAAFDEANALPDLNHAEHLGCRSVLFLVQALAEMGNSQLPKIWLLTRGAQPAWSRVRLSSIAQAPVWGLGRTLALEHPELWGGLIDIAPDSDPHLLAGRIVLEMCFPDGEDQVALSEDLRLVPRLVAAPPPLPTPMAIKRDCSYLITGGLGGLGPHIAEWLVDNGARYLILCGRREFPDRGTWEELTPLHPSYKQVVAIKKLEKQGATVEVEKVDVADHWQMEALFERMRLSSVPLRGIIHAAADIRFCPLRDMSADALHATMRAKVEGTWLLHELSRNLPLDFFVLFSSATALFGATRIGHYAASNHFLDFIAHSRRATGLSALSINWGAWEEIRLLGENRDAVKRFGLKAMPASLALQALSCLTTEGVAQRMVADVDWALLLRAFETRGRSNFFEHLSLKTAADQRVDPVEPGWIERLHKIAPEDRQELVSSLVAEETRRVLGLNAEEQLDPDRGLFELGMDSLMSVQLKGRLEKSVGCALPATLTFTYPTVHALTDFLLGEVLKLSATGAVDVASGNESSEVQSPDKDLADLSDDEVKDMLGAELSSLIQDLRE
jgi:acyl transferase domain-containing protein/acyl carrier protein/SAM-dependent methyltransferase/NADP-dependent 3-hydroxy acid dehydrogenase YdfG